MKKTMRHILRVLQCKKRKTRLDNLPLCYSTSGFLTDILEQNGFYVRKLECYGCSFTLEIDLVADEKMFRERLKRINKAIAYKFEIRNLG